MKFINRIFLFVLPIFVVAMYFYFLNPYPDYRVDQSNDCFYYIKLAKSIVLDGSYPSKHFLPGFPLLLSLWLRFTELDFHLLKFLSVCTSFLTLSFFYLYLRNSVDKKSATALTLVLAVNPTYFDYSHRLMSEVPYLLFFLTSLFLSEKFQKQHQSQTPNNNTYLHACLLTLVASITVMFRGNGLVLIPAFAFSGGYLLLKSKQQFNPQIIALTGVIIVFGAWSLFNANREFDGSHNVTYLSEVLSKDTIQLAESGGFEKGGKKASISEFFLRIKENAFWHIPYTICGFVLPGLENLKRIQLPFFGFILALAVISVVLLGFLEMLRKSPQGAICLIAGLILITVYPTGGSTRMMLPIAPLVIFACGLGVSKLFSKATYIWVGLATILGFIFCIQNGLQLKEQPYKDPAFGELLELVKKEISLSKKNGLFISDLDYKNQIEALTGFDYRNSEQIKRNINITSNYDVIYLLSSKSNNPTLPYLPDELRSVLNHCNEVGDFQLFCHRTSG